MLSQQTPLLNLNMSPGFQTPFPQQNLIPGLQDLSGLRLQQLSQQPLIVLDQEFLNNYSLNTNSQQNLNIQPQKGLQTLSDDDLKIVDDAKTTKDVGALPRPTAYGDCSYFTNTASYSFVDIAKGAVIDPKYDPQPAISKDNQ